MNIVSTVSYDTSEDCTTKLFVNAFYLQIENCVEVVIDCHLFIA